MKGEEYIVVLVTASLEEEADRIASALLESKAAACVNISGEVRSLFWWEGKIEQAQEVLLIIKTKKSLLDEVIRLVKQNHSYDVPEVIALPIAGGNLDYLEWIERVMK